MPNRNLTEREIVIEIAAYVAEAGSQKAFCQAHRISPQYLNDVLRERRAPGAKILRAIGYRRNPPTYSREPAHA